MGYTTDFEGEFTLDKPLVEKDYKLLKGLSKTRRMKRRVSAAEFGTDGEFYVEGTGYHGQGEDDSIVDYNTPPRTQPGLWCQWTPTSPTTIAWDGNEKFYNYVEWLKYLIDRIIALRGYVLNGTVEWYGEDRDDIGTIQVVDNKIIVS